jgi:hypothetical protein
MNTQPISTRRFFGSAIAVLLCSSLSTNAADYPRTGIPELQVPVKQFEAAVFENMARYSGTPVEALDRSSLRLTLGPNGPVASVTSRDGSKGLFLSPGRYDGTVTKQAPGVYCMTRASDGLVDVTLDGRAIPRFPVEPPQGPYITNFVHPSFGCGGWADPVLANACFFKLACLWTGVFCDSAP